MEKLFAIIPAAGSGTRMGEVTAERSKILLPVAPGKPSILEFSLQALVNSGELNGVVVAARAEDEKVIGEILERIAPNLQRAIVRGGETRQQSVWNALQIVRSQCEFVLVHDAARPLVPVEAVKAVVAQARETGAAILASKSVATVKRVNAAGVIDETIPRSEIWLAETPQVFKTELLIRGHESAEKARFIGTDESELVERLGIKVSVVEGSPRNIKVTTPADLENLTRLL